MLNLLFKVGIVNLQQGYLYFLIGTKQLEATREFPHVDDGRSASQIPNYITPIQS